MHIRDLALRVFGVIGVGGGWESEPIQRLLSEAEESIRIVSRELRSEDFEATLASLGEAVGSKPVIDVVTGPGVDEDGVALFERAGATVYRAPEAPRPEFGLVDARHAIIEDEHNPPDEPGAYYIMRDVSILAQRMVEVFDDLVLKAGEGVAG